jgi:hypothetical protein
MLMDWFLDNVVGPLLGWLHTLMPATTLPTPAETWVDAGTVASVLAKTTGLAGLIPHVVTMIGVTLTIAILWGALKLIDWIMDIIP